MFYAKVHAVRGENLVAVCDEELLGKKIFWNGIEIEIKEEFYGGMKIDEKECIQLLKKATIANLMGKNVVGLALREGFIEKENVLYINDIPHAQFVKL
ncbi:MAG: DUF424 family protein [Candidatus Aenigmarchaeota archaeon]|nr:DUF424 family protein [Candidatus Aenigmarchaeota archaeon]